MKKYFTFEQKNCGGNSRMIEFLNLTVRIREARNFLAIRHRDKATLKRRNKR